MKHSELYMINALISKKRDISYLLNYEGFSVGHYNGGGCKYIFEGGEYKGSVEVDKFIHGLNVPIVAAIKELVKKHVAEIDKKLSELGYEVE